jgi:hypothetical protein
VVTVGGGRGRRHDVGPVSEGVVVSGGAVTGRQRGVRGVPPVKAVVSVGGGADVGGCVVVGVGSELG